MGTYSKILLSGSTDGQAISVTGTAATVHTLIHTSVTGATNAFDEMYVYAHNTATVASIVRFTVAATGAASSVTAQTFGYELTAGGDVVYTAGLILVVPGLMARNTKALLAWCTAVGKVNLRGYVHRYTS
jgi:hypothetical protein